MTPFIFALCMIAMFLFGFFVQWIASGDERKRLKRFEQHYQKTVALDQERAYLQQSQGRQSRRRRR